MQLKIVLIIIIVFSLVHWRVIPRAESHRSSVLIGSIDTEKVIFNKCQKSVAQVAVRLYNIFSGIHWNDEWLLCIWSWESSAQ